MQSKHKTQCASLSFYCFLIKYNKIKFDDDDDFCNYGVTIAF